MLGANFAGQLGDGTTTGHLNPTQVPGTGWTSLSDGEDHACGTQTGATAACWGNGSSGQLGSILLWVPVAVIDPAP